MSANGHTLTEPELLAEELQSLAERRAEAFRRELDQEGDPGGGKNPQRVTAPESAEQATAADEARRRSRIALAEEGLRERPHLAGLSLSGGGIRAASFSLGLVQALYERGVLRHIDYLSTVSGGGYLGSFLTSLVHRRQCDGRRIDWAPAPSAGQSATNTEPSASSPLEIVADADGKQPPSVERLLFGGLQLRKPLIFFNHYVSGLLLINLAVFSALLFLCMSAAWLFRLLDIRRVMLALDVIGFQGDVRRAFFPSVVIFVLWIVARTLTTLLAAIRGGRRFYVGTWCCQALLVCSALLAVFGFIAVLGNGDLSIIGRDALGGFEPAANQIHAHKDEFKLLLGVLLVAAILPYVRLNDLIRSGTRPRSAVEGWIFAIASRALLYGVPLAVFAICVRENISGYIGGPDHKDVHLLTFMHVADSNAFWSKVRDDATQDADAEPASPTSPAAALWKATTEVDASVKIGDTVVICEWDECIHPVEQALQPRDKEEYDLRQFRERIRKDYGWRLLQDARQTAITDAVNRRALRDTGFWKAFDSLDGDNNIVDQKQRRRIAQLVPRARLAGERLDLNGADERLERELERFNRQLLDAYYGDRIRDESTVFAGVALVAGSIVNLNFTSIQRFYRDRLASVWIEPDPKHGARIPLGALDTTRAGAPCHLIGAALNFLSRKDAALARREPTGPFLFSHLALGSKRACYRSSATYQNLGRKLDLAEAMAISGAAVSPSVVGNPLLATLMFVFNWRTGWWFCNALGLRQRATSPSDGTGSLRHSISCLLTRIRAWISEHGWPAPLFSLLAYGTVRSENRAYLFVSDGGHYENLGLEALLLRRCRFIIAADAGHDADSEFVDLLRVIRRGRVIHGIRFFDASGNNPWEIDALVPDRVTKLTRGHYLMARIVYPEVTESHPAASVKEGVLIYIKPTLTGDEDLELLRYRSENASFPHDSTLDQFFDYRRSECYRQLGHHIGSQLCNELTDSRAELGRCGGLADWRPGDDFATGPNCLTPDVLAQLADSLNDQDDLTRLYSAREIADRGLDLESALRMRSAATKVLNRRLRVEEDTAVRRELYGALQRLRRAQHGAEFTHGIPEEPAARGD